MTLQEKTHELDENRRLLGMAVDFWVYRQALFAVIYLLFQGDPRIETVVSTALGVVSLYALILVLTTESTLLKYRLSDQSALLLVLETWTGVTLLWTPETKQPLPYGIKLLSKVLIVGILPRTLAGTQAGYAAVKGIFLRSVILAAVMRIPRISILSSLVPYRNASSGIAG